MEDFTFLNPTKIVFGRGRERDVGKLVKPFADKVLIVYGKGSIKRPVKNDGGGFAPSLYDRICFSLEKEGVKWTELPGVQPNPRLELVRKGIEICRKEKITFVLAAGGGSVIDTAKAIAAGVPFKGDVWDLFGGEEICEVLPTGVVLTIPAAGSESSNGAVITNEDGWFKRAIVSETLRPKFAILDPELTFSLSDYQTMVGVADITAHLLERYFTKVPHVDLSDRLIEGTMRSIIDNSRILAKEPGNYDARAEIMWAGTIAHNDLFTCGRTGDWASHMIEHELSGIYDVPHGAGLAVIFPAWMTYVCGSDPATCLGKVAQFAVRVWDVEQSFGSPEQVALEGISRLKSYYKELGLPASLRELDIPNEKYEEMAKKCTEGGPVGSFMQLHEKDALEILRLAEK